MMHFRVKWTQLIAFLLCMLLIASHSLCLAEQQASLVTTPEQGASLYLYPRSSSTRIGFIPQFEYLDVLGIENGWYRVQFNGQSGWVDGDVVNVAEYANAPTALDLDPNAPYDIGIPYIGNRVYSQGDMNLIVYWVQKQLKATGIWFQGDVWNVTGRLKSHCMSEISSFMASQGYRGHSGKVDQQVIDALADYLGDAVVPVYTGGWYDGMNSILTNPSDGSMVLIVSNLRDMVPRVNHGARWVQFVLNRIGYYNGGIDGKYGEQTERAVMQFQAAHGLQERDYVTFGVARAMLEEYIAMGYSYEQLP